MRRGIAPCVVDADHNGQTLQRLEFGDRDIAEEFLQITLHKSPSLLPVADIDPSYGPLVSLGREVDNIDNLFISPLGRITLVETKLWRNPQATREVVAQILEYATRLNTWTYQELEAHVREGVEPTPLGGERSLHGLVAAAFPDQVLPEEQFVDEVSRTLRTGRFLLLVIGDGIREGVDGLLEALHRHPQLLFTFAMVETQIFVHPKDPSLRIVIPQVIANTVEVVRAVVKVHASAGAQVSVSLEDDAAPGRSTGTRRTLSESEFFAEVTDPVTASTFRRLLAFGNEIGAVPGWRASSVSVQLPDPAGSKQRVTLFVMTTTGEIYLGWTIQQMDSLGLDPKLAKEYVRSIARIFPGVTVDTKKPDSLSRELTAAEVESAFARFVDTVRAFTQAVIGASKR